MEKKKSKKSINKNNNKNIITVFYRIIIMFFKGIYLSLYTIIKTFYDVFIKYLFKGIIYFCYLVYSVITLKAFRTPKKNVIADNKPVDKLVLEDLEDQLASLENEEALKKGMSKAELRKFRIDTKKAIKDAKRKNRIELLKSRNKVKMEALKEKNAQKGEEDMKEQKANILRKSRADKKIERREILDREKLKKKQLKHEKEIAKIEAKNKRKLENEERKRAIAVARIEKERARMKEASISKREKVLGAINKQIEEVKALLAKLEVDFNKAATTEQKIKIRKNILLYKDKLDRLEGQYKMKEAEFDEQEKKELERYEERLAKAENRHKAQLDKETRKLRFQKERENAFIKDQNAKQKRKFRIDQALDDVKDAEEKEKLKNTMSLGKRFKKWLKNRRDNSLFAKNKRNKEAISKEALLISFNDEDIKSDVKIVFEYQGRDPDGKIVKGYFEAYSKTEVHSYLLAEGFDIYSIRTSKLIQILHGSEGMGVSNKINLKDLIFMLTQLSTYIKAGIPLVEAIRILSKQYKKKKYQKLFTSLMYDLTMGDNFSIAMEKQGNAFPRLLINMVKASELTGELPESLDEMADYYTRRDAVRKQMITALMYPSIIFFVAIAVMTFIMVYVIPQFVKIYESMDDISIPSFTLAIITLSTFLKNNGIWLLLGIFALVAIIAYLYKNVKVVRAGLQWLVMHMVVIGNVIIYNEVNTFTKTFASLLKHNVFITDSMEILSKLTNNEIYKMIILDTITNLARGEKISTSFKDQWAFPVAAYEMIVTGEKTGQLAEMMDKVADYYQDMHANAVQRIKTFIEPIMIILLTVCTGIIVTAVIVPMFSMYDQLSSMSST